MAINRRTSDRGRALLLSVLLDKEEDEPVPGSPSLTGREVPPLITLLVERCGEAITAAAVAAKLDLQGWTGSGQDGDDGRRVCCLVGEQQRCRAGKAFI